MMKTGYASSFQTALLVVVMAATWILFAPTEFGGSATYVIVAGASMEPELQQGDLVIARQSSGYNVGDVAAYLHPQVGPVIHRVIERQGPTYTFQGDNNDWVDSFEPAAAEILGRSWLHIDGGADILVWLRTPLGLSLLSLSVGSMFLLILGKNDQRQKNQRRRVTDMFSRWYRQAQSLRLMEWVFPLSILLCAAILLGLFAFARPQFETIPADLPYTHHGNFAYAGVGSPAVYDQGQIASGEAVFHALVHELDLEFAYTFESIHQAELAGTYTVYVRISEPNGWQRTLELQPETAFQGESFQMATTLDIDQITTIVERLRNRTAFNQQTFNVDVNVSIAVTGSLSGLPFGDTYTARLPFILDESELYVESSDPDRENGDPLSLESTAYLSNTDTIPNTLSIIGLVLTVNQARTIAWIAGGISLALLAFILAPAMAVSKNRPSERIKLNHADRLIDVMEIPYEADLAWVEVTSFEDLVKISENSGALIMHLHQGDKHTYVIEHSATGYRFIIHDADDAQHNPGLGDATVDPPAQPEDER